MGRTDRQSHTNESCKAGAPLGSLSKNGKPEAAPPSSQPRFVDTSARDWISSSVEFVPSTSSGAASRSNSRTGAASRSNSRRRKSDMDKGKDVKRKVVGGSSKTDSCTDLRASQASGGPAGGKRHGRQSREPSPASPQKGPRKKEKSASRCSSLSSTDNGEQTSCSEDKSSKERRKGQRRSNKTRKSENRDALPSSLTSSVNSSWMSASLESNQMSLPLDSKERSRRASRRKSSQEYQAKANANVVERGRRVSPSTKGELPGKPVQTDGSKPRRKKDSSSKRCSSQSSTDAGEQTSCSEGHQSSSKFCKLPNLDVFPSSPESTPLSSSLHSSWMSSSCESNPTSPTMVCQDRSGTASRRKSRPSSGSSAPESDDTGGLAPRGKNHQRSRSPTLESTDKSGIASRRRRSQKSCSPDAQMSNRSPSPSHTGNKQRSPKFVAAGDRTWMSRSEQFSIEPKVKPPTKSVQFDFWDDPAPLPDHLGDGTGRLVLPGTLCGLLPTTQHVLQRAIAGPPLSSAWVQSSTLKDWFSSRAAPGWVFKVSEHVLFHAETSTLWELGEESGGAVVRRMDTAGAKQGAVVGFAESNLYVLLRACFKNWGRLAREMKTQETCSPQAKLLECVVCLDHFLVGVGSQSGAISCGDCQHMLCIECLSSYATCAVELRQWNANGLPCPVPDCSACIPGIDVLKTASLTTVQCEDIAMHLCRLLVSRPVCCPNPECNAMYDSGQFSGDCPRATCHECKQDFCRKCQCAWHYGRTCEGERSLDPLSQIAQELGWRRCANCGTMIERLEGCNHMQCTSCNYHFCYRCGGPFSGGKCLDEGCGIYQGPPALPRQHARAALGALWNASWLNFSSPPPLSEDRREFLSSWATSHRDEVDLSLLARQVNFWVTLPAWQRQLFRDSWCPYCQQTESSLEALEEHLQTQCRAQVWTCCGRIFLNAEELDVHIHDRHRNSFS